MDGVQTGRQALMAAIPPWVAHRRTLARAGLVSAGISAAVLIIDFSVQLTTVQTSRLIGELDDGPSLLPMYSPDPARHAPALRRTRRPGMVVLPVLLR